MKLRNVNTTDIGAAIQAGARTMASVFNADDDDIPFFRSEVWPDPHLAFSSVHSEAHVPGRHLNALLTAESLGFAIDEAAVEKHARAAFFSYGAPLPLPLNRERIDGPLVNFRPHNVREGFHALYALARFRDSAGAREVAEASIAAINRLWDPDRGWDRDGATRAHGIDVTIETTFIRGLGRAIGPLVKYYRATGYGPALDLAIRLKDKAVADHFTADGSYDTARFGPHTHSTTCVMSSLAQLADLLTDAPLMERVRMFYTRGLWDIRDELGWVIESSLPDAPPDFGEANNTGDILETALILGRWGYPEAYDDAERILRGHLLPSQLRDVSWIQEPSSPADGDGRRDVARAPLGGVWIPRALWAPSGRGVSHLVQHGCRGRRRGVALRGLSRRDPARRGGSLGQSAVRPPDRGHRRRVALSRRRARRHPQAARTALRARTGLGGPGRRGGAGRNRHTAAHGATFGRGPAARRSAHHLRA